MNQTEKYIKQYEDAFNLKKTKYKEGIKKKIHS